VLLREFVSATCAARAPRSRCRRDRVRDEALSALRPDRRHLETTRSASTCTRIRPDSETLASRSA
jgi:hypothetical protein